MAAGTSFCTETVFSHESRIELIREAKNAGFTVYLIAVCVENPALAEMRVQQRVARQGHDVPSDRIHQRYPSTLRNLARAARIADCILIFDNSRVNAMPRLVFVAGMGSWVILYTAKSLDGRAMLHGDHASHGTGSPDEPARGARYPNTHLPGY